MRIRQKNRVVAIGAGGTGGHIFPALAVAKTLIENGYKVIFFTDIKFLKYIPKDNPLLSLDLFKLVFLSCKNAPRWKQCFYILKDLWTCKKIILHRVSLCIGFGGYSSFPVVLFGILTFRRTIIHEQNAVMGLSNRLLLPFVRVALLSFENTKKIGRKIRKKKCLFVGNPIRDEIKKYVYKYDNPSVNYRAFYKIEDKINITIMGGSQASGLFDTLIPNAIGSLPANIANKIQVIHQCRIENKELVEEMYTENHITHDVRAFFQDVGQILRSSHLLISRAGATTLFEIMALGVPSILIPLPTATDEHQLENAKFLRDINGAIMLEQSSITKNRIVEILTRLFSNDNLLFELSQNATKQSQVYADVKIFAIINRCLGYTEDVQVNKIQIGNARYINDNVGLG